MKNDEQKQTQQRTRKEYAAKGEKAQKMMSFRVDLDNLAWLQQQPNKGRYINDLIQKDRGGSGGLPERPRCPKGT